MRTLYEDTRFLPHDDRLTVHRVRWDPPASTTASTVVRDLWFRFVDVPVDPEDPEAPPRFACYVYADRVDAIKDDQPYRSILAKAYQQKPDDPSGTFSLLLTPDPGAPIDLSGCVLEMQINPMPTPWTGCVWAYISPTGQQIAEDVAATLTDHTGEGKALEGLSFVATPETAAYTGPRVEVTALPHEITPGPISGQWRAVFTLRLLFLLDTFGGTWWRKLVQWMRAAVSVICDEASIPGVFWIAPAGGTNPRDGRAELMFRAEVGGFLEPFVTE